VYNTGLLSEFNIQYIEQPVIKNTELLELAEISKIAVAPDESVGNIEDAIEFINSEKISYLILKPSLRIGISNTIKLRESAKRKNVKLIITSGFDTALGRSALLYLASLMDHDDAHGLSAELLGKNEFIADINFSSPRLSISQTNFLFKSVIEV
jgi:O-succinylbenzoate synthase